MIRMLALASVLTVAAHAAAIEPASGYRVPSPDLVKLADAPQPLLASPGPGDDWVLFLEYPSLLSIEDLAQPELKLAGLRFNPERHAPTRDLYANAARFVRLSQREAH